MSKIEQTQNLTNDRNNMAPPTPMDCSAPWCDYRTPDNTPTWDLVLRALEVHTSIVHSSPSKTKANIEQFQNLIDNRINMIPPTPIDVECNEAIGRALRIWECFDCTEVDPEEQYEFFIEMIKTDKKN